MSISKKLLTVGALALSLSMYSCKDDENSSSISKADAQRILGDFNTSTQSDLQDFSSTDGLEAIQTFFDLTSIDDPFGARVATDRKGLRKFFQDKGERFKSVFAPVSTKGRVAQDGGFDFEANKGVYEWNAVSEVFELTAQATTIKIKFPTEGSETNNAELNITAYSEVEVYDEDAAEYYYTPVELKATIKVDNETVSAIDLAMEYDDNGFPLLANISFSATPYTATLTFDDSNTTTSTIGATLLNGNETLLATSVSVKYEDESKSEESLKLVTGFVQVNSLKLQGEIDFAAGDQAEVDLNEIFKLTLYSNGDKVGKVVFEEINEELVPYLQYTDGSKEKLEDVLAPVIEEIEELKGSIDENS
jgi:hypothetical protein